MKISGNKIPAVCLILTFLLFPACRGNEKASVYTVCFLQRPVCRKFLRRRQAEKGLPLWKEAAAYFTEQKSVVEVSNMVQDRIEFISMNKSNRNSCVWQMEENK